MVVAAPPVRRRIVGKALRRHRESLGFTLEDVAAMLDCDRSKLSRIETGQRGIRREDLRKLLAEYGVAGEQALILAELADPRGAFGWQRDYADVLPDGARDYLILEPAAPKIAVYEAQRVPVLLQTPAYARALAEADPAVPDGMADRAAQAVLARQQAVLGERRPGVYPGNRRPAVHAVIGQAALHQQVGGEAVMAEQLRLLARIAGDSGQVTVQVLEFGAGAHAGAGDGSVELLRFTGVQGLGLVRLGGVGGGACLEGQDDVEACGRVLDQLHAFALSPVQSALLLRGMAGD